MDNNIIEYQVKRNFQWVFCSYSTYLKDKRNFYSVRKRNLKNGANWGMMDTTQAKEAIKKATI